MESARKALLSAKIQYRFGGLDQFQAAEKQRKKLQAFQKAEQKYKNFYARQQYAQQAFEKLNS